MSERASESLSQVVGVPVGLVSDVLTAFAVRGLTIATAESLTGGLLAAVLTEVPGSSAVVRGGLVVYATDLKDHLAGVDPALLAERGSVDPLVAAALAEGARQRCGAAIGVGLTGVAGPDRLNGIAVGTWFCAVSGPGAHRDERHGGSGAGPVDRDVARGIGSGIDDQTRGVGTRARIRSAAVRGALEMLANIAATHS